MKKLISALLAALITLGCCAPALGENIKHERVYIVAGPDGEVRSLTDSIRLENKDGLDEIIDASLLTGIENMSGNEAFAQDGDALVWQAQGHDIIYQGTSDRAPAVLPLVTLTLDGEEVTAEELKTKTGEAVLSVRFKTDGTMPALALTVMLLPAEGVSELTMENCTVLTEMGRQVLVGWALPGLEESWNLPAGFTASFHADHADLGWMMTLISSDPLDIACQTLQGKIPLGLNARSVLEDTKTALTAIQNGEDVPALHGLAQVAALKINELNGGLTQLNDGAVQLEDGTKQLKDGAAKLKTGSMLALVGASTMDEGLKVLQGKSEELNAGASKMADAILGAANAQLAASSLTVPALTLENYAETLAAVLEQIPESAEGERAAVNTLLEQLDQVKSFVTGCQDYTAGVDRAAATSGQLKSGMKQIDDGIKALSDGAKQLADGASTLQQDGTQKLKDTLTDAEKLLAKKLLPFLENEAEKALDLYERILNQKDAGGYDLRPDGMTTVTAYLIRTDLQ